MDCLLVLLAIFISGFALQSSAHPAGPSQTQASSLCQSPECIHAASNILYNLHPNYTSIDPCTHFDQYVCGGWGERYDMRPDQQSISTGTIMAENTQSRLRHIMEASGPPDPSDSENFQKLETAYGACLNESTIQKRGTKPLDDMLAGMAKIYSPSSNKGVKDGLTDAIVYLMKTGTTAFVEYEIGADDRNPDSVVIFVEPPTQIGLQAKQSYNNTKTVAEYSAVVKQVLGNFSDTEIGDQASDVVEFETKLANVTPDAQVLADVNQYYNPFSIKETQSLLPQVSFSEVISKLAPSDYKGDRLIVASPSYMKSLAKILSKTPRGTVQLFLKWKLIQQYADKIEDAKVEPFREFNNKLAGKDPRAREDRWRTCITSLDNGLGWILSRFYVLSYFPKGSKKLGDQMVTELKEWYVSTLRHTDWMSPEVRKRAIQKVHAMAQEVGYPTEDPNVLDAAAVQEYYQGLNMSSQTYFENEVGVAEFQLHQEWSKLGKPTNRDEWGMKAQTVNAYYNPTSNEIVFPAGIMQPPSFYGPDTPMYLNYGAFGSVCGHELSHAFDNHGKDYDATGNYTDWWDEKTTKAFEKRSQCFVDQYSKYTVTGPDGTVYHVNGQLTLGENIADTGGLEAAFNTWRQRHASADLRLPGLTQFTKEQIFFIAHANWWCSKSTPEALVQLIHADPHPPASARVLGQLADSRAFKEAFNCANKEPVCKMW